MKRHMILAVAVLFAVAGPVMAQDETGDGGTTSQVPPSPGKRHVQSHEHTASIRSHPKMAPKTKGIPGKPIHANEQGH